MCFDSVGDAAPKASNTKSDRVVAERFFNVCPLSPGQVDRSVRDVKREFGLNHMKAQHFVAVGLGFLSWADYQRWYKNQ